MATECMEIMNSLCERDIFLLHCHMQYLRISCLFKWYMCLKECNFFNVLT